MKSNQMAVVSENRPGAVAEVMSPEGGGSTMSVEDWKMGRLTPRMFCTD